MVVVTIADRSLVAGAFALVGALAGRGADRGADRWKAAAKSALIVPGIVSVLYLLVFVGSGIADAGGGMTIGEASVGAVLIYGAVFLVAGFPIGGGLLLSRRRNKKGTAGARP
jgi:hypothetical protein